MKTLAADPTLRQTHRVVLRELASALVLTPPGAPDRAVLALLVQQFTHGAFTLENFVGIHQELAVLRAHGEQKTYVLGGPIKGDLVRHPHLRPWSALN